MKPDVLMLYPTRPKAMAALEAAYALHRYDTAADKAAVLAAAGPVCRAIVTNGHASLTREMAADFGPLGIRVNAISPGEIDTAILSPGTEKIVATLPLGRLGKTEEVARAIHFLCTDASSYVTGAELHINGGQHV